MHDDFAIVLISGKRTEYYLHNVNSTKFLKKIEEDLPNQHKTGGQSAPRFGRIRDEKINWYAKKIVELMVNFYVSEGKFRLKGLVIAGPAEMKDLVSEQDLFIKYFSKNLLKTLTIAEINERSINNVIVMASDVLTSNLDENNLIKEFDEKLSVPGQIDLIIFGIKEVIFAFDVGELKEIYVGEKSVYKDQIIKSTTKTKIIIIRSTEFISKYGELVGIKYFVNDYDQTSGGSTVEC